MACLLSQTKEHLGGSGLVLLRSLLQVLSLLSSYPPLVALCWLVTVLGVDRLLIWQVSPVTSINSHEAYMPKKFIK